MPGGVHSLGKMTFPAYRSGLDHEPEEGSEAPLERGKAEPYESEDIERETRRIQRVALIGFLLNLSLALIKAVLAVFSNSLAVTASFIDSGSDCVASLVLFAGLKLSTRKTKTFPQGLYKIENFLSILVALFIMFAGYEIARRIIEPAADPPHISASVLAWLAVGVPAVLGFGIYVGRVAKETGSPTLRAESGHRRVDVLSSLVVLASAAMNYFGIEYSLRGVSIDQLGAALVLVFIASAGWSLLSDGMRVLLDASIDFGTLERVRRIIEGEPSVSAVNSVVGRNAGRFLFLHVDLALRINDLKKAHLIGERLKESVRSQVPKIERITIEYEPKSREVYRVAVPIVDPEGRIADHFGEAPYFAILKVRLADKGTQMEKILPNPFLDVPKGKGIRVAEWLVDEKIDELVVKELLKHRGPGYVLSNAGVRHREVSCETLAELMNEGSEPCPEEKKTKAVGV